MTRHTLIAAILAAAVFFVFLPVRENQFLNYDDDFYLTANPVVAAGLSWSGVAWAFTSVEGGNWHPLTWVSHLLDVKLFGMNPGRHHLMSAGLHALSAALLFLSLCAMTGTLGPPLFVAALFAVHPLHVESVAWAAERKDVLMGLFWALTLLAYHRYVRRPGLPGFLTVAACCLLALLAKSAAVALPPALLLLDFWPLSRMRRASAAGLILEKIPLLLLAAVCAVVTYRAQDAAGALLLNRTSPLPVRLGNAVDSVVAYLRALLWPVDLAHYYPYPLGTLSPWPVAGALALLGIATAGAWFLRRHHPAVVTGWLWYLLTLAPMLGVMQIGAQARADRYTYVPLTGLFLAGAWEARAFVAGHRARLTFAVVAGCLIVAALIPMTRRQIGFWRDTITLSRHTLAVTRDNWFVENNLGVALFNDGRNAEALACFRESLRINPEDRNALNNLGSALVRLGRYGEALYWFSRAAQVDPGSAIVRENIAITRGLLGREVSPPTGSPPPGDAVGGEPGR